MQTQRKKRRKEKKKVEGGEIKTETENKCEPYMVKNFTRVKGSVARITMFIKL